MKSRRKFSKEFKLTAIRRLQSGQSAAEVARVLEVNPTDLYRWRREVEERGERAFSGGARNAPRRARWPNWSARSAGQPWRSIF